MDKKQNAPETKICTMCGEEKPLDDFYRQKKTRDGHHASCKDCQKRRYRRLPEQTKKKEEKPLTAATQQNNVPEGLRIDFTRYPDLLKGLHAMATEEFRTPEEQALYIIKTALDRHEDRVPFHGGKYGGGAL